jgi:predicted aspartyl protease
MEKEFDYKQEESDVFGSIKRPRIEIQIFSKKKDRWIWVDEVLADTGADFCVLPRYLGNFFVEDITTGKYVEIKGVVPGTRLIAYIHRLKIKIADRELETYVAIADSDDVPSIFGRVKGLDEFDANFLKGEKVKLHCEE